LDFLKVPAHIPQPDGVDKCFQIGNLGRTPLETEEAVQQSFVELLKKNVICLAVLFGDGYLCDPYYKDKVKHSQPSDVYSSPIFLTLT
jgi:hypothetical protein